MECLSNIYRTTIEHLSMTYRTSIHNLSTTYRAFTHPSNNYRNSIELCRKYIKHLSRIYRTHIGLERVLGVYWVDWRRIEGGLEEDWGCSELLRIAKCQSNMYRTSTEQLSNIYRNSVENISNIYRESIERLLVSNGSKVYLGWIGGLREDWRRIGNARNC